MLNDVQILLEHFAKDKKLEITSVPCIQHTVEFIAENPLYGNHSKLEYKKRIEGLIDHIFNDKFYLYSLNIQGKQTVVVTIVEVKDKIDIETGKEVIIK